MAITNSDGSIVLTTKVDTSGMKKSTNELRSEAMKLAAQYRKAGMSQSEAQKRAYKELGVTTKETEKATKATKQYGDQAQKSGKMAKTAFAAVGKAAAALAIASAAAVVAVTKQAVEAYAEYEQLVGGVETLFKNSSKKVLEYANEAYKTTGLSANEYMATVTSFSASLLSSLEGDTDKAAEVANSALISMSDNVNKMGSSVESVQLAFQGFAKQQYMLLDNLKLGYGGTKTEMERLLKDAQAITGVEYNIDNLADVYTAIGVIQEKLGIAGTTAKEASTTISGSAATMKAAWQNVLTAISGGGDLDRAINNLVDSISIYFQNIVPVVERALSGIGVLIEKVAPMLVQTVAKSLIAAIPSLLNAVYEMIIGLSKGIYQGIIDLFNGTSREVLTEQADNIQQSVKNQNDLTKAVEETNAAMEKTTASFDTVEILSAGTAQEASAEPIVPEISGGSLGENLEIEETEKELSAFEKALKKSFDKISKTIKKAWDSKPVQAFWKAVKSYGGFLWDYWSTLGTSLWGNLKSTWDKIEGDFGMMTSNIVGLWTVFWQDVRVGIDTWGQPIIDGVNGVFNSIWTTAIDPYIQLMVGAWSDFTGILKSKWEEYGQPLIDNIGQFATNVISLFQSIYDNILEPIITPFLETMSSLWDEHISVMIEKAVDFVMKLINGALEIYNKFIHPIVMWLTETLEPIFTWIGNYISGVFHTIVSTVSDVLGDVFDALGGLIDFIVGAFTGDWEQAWNGIKAIFVGIWDVIVDLANGAVDLVKGAWDAVKGFWNTYIAPVFTLKWWQNLAIDCGNGLIAGFEAAVNNIISLFETMINLIIGGLNEIKIELPDWDILGDLAGAKFGVAIKEVDFSEVPIGRIPKLAQGSVIPPNREFLAVLGDNTKEHEIVSPLSTMKRAFAEAMVEMGGSFGGGNTEVVLEIDGREFGRAVVEQGNRENRRIGTRLVIV